MQRILSSGVTLATSIARKPLPCPAPLVGLVDRDSTLPGQRLCSTRPSPAAGSTTWRKSARSATRSSPGEPRSSLTMRAARRPVPRRSQPLRQAGQALRPRRQAVRALPPPSAPSTPAVSLGRLDRDHHRSEPALPTQKRTADQSCRMRVVVDVIKLAGTAPTERARKWSQLWSLGASLGRSFTGATDCTVGASASGSGR